MKYPYTDLSIAKNLLILDLAEDAKDLCLKLNVRIEQLESSKLVSTQDIIEYNKNLLPELKRCRKYLLYVMACFNLEIKGGEK